MALVLADIFLYSYEAEFIQSLLSTGRKRLASVNFTYRYIDDVLSSNNPDFENYLGQMYPPELEIKEIYVTAYRGAGRQKKLDLRSGSHAIDIS